MHWRVRAVVAAGLASACALAVSGCDGSSPTSPTTTTSTTTVAEATVSETFDGAVAVGGSAFYSFTVPSNGTVNVTLAAVSGPGVPGTVWLGLGIGQPNAEDCASQSTLNTQAGTAVHLTGTYAPGVYCVRVWDIGNLNARASVSIAIAHP